MFLVRSNFQTDCVEAVTSTKMNIKPLKYNKYKKSSEFLVMNTRKTGVFQKHNRTYHSRTVPGI